MSSDSDIIASSIADPAAFGEIFDRHAAAIHRYIARRTDSTVADDVVAQTFLVAFERRAAYSRDREVAAPWLYGIATNLLRRHRRDEARMMRALQRSTETDQDPGAIDRVGERLTLTGRWPSSPRRCATCRGPSETSCSCTPGPT